MKDCFPPRTSYKLTPSFFFSNRRRAPRLGRMLARHARCRLAALVAALTFAGPDGCRGDRFWNGCLSVETRLGRTDTWPNSDPRIAHCRNSPFDVLDAAHIRRLELIAAVIADPTSFGDLNETEA